jgi:hypothetical protein
MGPMGQRADRNDLQVDGIRMWISLLDQGPGLYRVRWTAVADDDKGQTRGDYTFTIQRQLPTDVPRLMVNPPVADNGQELAIAGAGFTPGGDVVISIGDDEQLLALARADGRGHFSLQAALPANLPFGRQVLEAADAQDHFATAAIRVPQGGSPVAVPKLNGEAEPDEIAYTVRVENLSGYALQQIVLRVAVPRGTPVLRDGIEQPEGVDPPSLEDGHIVWRARTLPPHSILGPFAFNVLTAGLPGRPELVARATLEYAHGSPPLFRGSAGFDEVRVQVSNR